jgi:hypothetical protein
LTGAEVLSRPAPGTVEDNSNVQRSTFSVQRSGDKGKKVIASDFQPVKILANYNQDVLAHKWRIP